MSDKVTPEEVSETMYKDSGGAPSVVQRNITPDDSNDLVPPARALRCNLAGAVTYLNMRDESVVFTAFAGETYAGNIKRLMETGTDNTGATDYVAHYGAPQD